jgi:hypothetical protein
METPMENKSDHPAAPLCENCGTEYNNHDWSVHCAEFRPAPEAKMPNDGSWWIDRIRTEIADGWRLTLVKDNMTQHVPERVYQHLDAALRGQERTEKLVEKVKYHASTHNLNSTGTCTCDMCEIFEAYIEYKDSQPEGSDV